MASSILTALALGASFVSAAGDWAAADTLAKAAVARLTQQEKVNIVTGIGWGKGACVGNTAAVPSIRYPSLCLQDGPLGVRYGTGTTAFTPGIQAVSTWDVDLIRQRGQFLGAEAKACGVHVLLGPAPGALGKIPHGGRNWEGFGPDPYLAGVATYETVSAMQAAGVQASTKHYLANEQELNRETMSSNVDDRSLHELYLWPFAEAVRAGSASVMCSYNKLNSTWACENKRILNDILKQELGFQGYVVSDWNAQHSTNAAATNGMDMSMPGSDFNGRNILWGPALNTAVNGNQVARTRLDDMATRILRAWYFTGQETNYPPVNIRANVQGNHKENVRAVARDGIVLLKNEDDILPLTGPKPKRIAVIGTASQYVQKNTLTCADNGCNTGALGFGWGSGTTNFPYFSSPIDAIRTRAQQDGATVTHANTDNAQQGASAAQGADVAIVFITADSGEGYITVEGNAGDRKDLDPWHGGNDLVRAVAAANKNVIVVVHSVGPILLESILGNDGVRSIVWAGLPSQENGNALVDVLWGATNPNGKLPYTIGRTAADYGTAVTRGDDNFPEKLYIDYRAFDKKGVAPRFEFGFGMSYTTFSYSAISVTSTAKSGPATGTIVPGGREDLYDTVATVTATITNSGTVSGAEVAQLYIGFPSGSPETPTRQLRGFDKLKLEPGASATAIFNIKRKDLSVWDSRTQNWIVPAGSFKVEVGASSRDLRLTGSLSVM